MSTGTGSNHSFARKLASSDKSTREKAVAFLVLWLSCQQDIGEEELKKIWKGLFYCVWHADKAPVQAQLIERLAGLLENVEVELSISFFKVFLSTIRREWGGIDRLRLDKFYLLIRKFLSHMFKVLENGGWEKELVTKFMDALEQRAFMARDRFPALGVNLHFADIFWDEFRKFLPVPDGTLELLLEPFYSILSTSSDKALLKRVRENIFNPLLDDARSLVSLVEAKRSVEGTTGTIGRLLNSTSVAPRLFDLASSPSTAQANRKVLYELNDEFSKLAKSFELLKGTAFQFNRRSPSLLHSIAAKDTDNFMGSQLEDVDGVSRTRSRKRQSRSATVGVKMPLQGVSNLKVKKPRKVKKELSPVKVGGQDNDKKVSSGHEEHSQADAKEENERQVMVAKKKRKSGTDVTFRTDGHLLLKKSAKKTAGKRKGPSKLVHVESVDGAADAAQERDNNWSVRDPEINSHLDNVAHAGVGGYDSTENGQQDIDEVTVNLEKMFDIVAAGESVPAPESSLEMPCRKKRKRVKASVQSTSLTTGLTSGAENVSDAQPALQPPSMAGVNEQTPLELAKKAKRVRFVLRNNLICKPHAPLPPLSLRTPPSATPRGSALKSGVPPGPIRTRPIRMARGSVLAKSRKRATRQLLTISMQKPKISTRKLRSRPK